MVMNMGIHRVVREVVLVQRRCIVDGDILRVWKEVGGRGKDHLKLGDRLTEMFVE